MERSLIETWEEIVIQAAWTLVFPHFRTLVPAEMCLALPTFTQGQTPYGNLLREAFSTSPSQRAATLTFYHLCLLGFLSLSSPSSLRMGASQCCVLSTQEPSLAGGLLSKYGPRLVIRMLCALLRLL